MRGPNSFAGGHIAGAVKVAIAENKWPVTKTLPDLATGKTRGGEILQARLKTLFELGAKDALVSAETVFENPGAFQIVNYCHKENYLAGHIVGAVWLEPLSGLGLADSLARLSPHLPIVLYSESGHLSGFAAAVLRLFGFSAKSLLYGNNAVMHGKLMANGTKGDRVAFGDDKIEDFVYEK